MSEGKRRGEATGGVVNLGEPASRSSGGGLM